MILLETDSYQKFIKSPGYLNFLGEYYVLKYINYFLYVCILFFKGGKTMKEDKLMDGKAKELRNYFVLMIKESQCNNSAKDDK